MTMPSIRTVGYRQIWEYLTKEVNYSQMIERAVAATRQLAKRQITWLRTYPDLHAFDSANSLIEKQCTEYLQQRMRP